MQIQFYNRYREKTYLQRVTDTIYEFRYKDDENKDNFCRYGYEENKGHKKYVFVDPSGGPYISIGTQVMTVVVDNVRKEMTLEVEDIEINPSNNHTVLKVKPIKFKDL